jgi:hypothetical protein
MPTEREPADFIEPENMNRHQLIKFLVGHVYPSAGHTYQDNVHLALQKQTTETLRGMALVTRKQEVQRQQKRRLQSAARKADEHKHTTAHGAH